MPVFAYSFKKYLKLKSTYIMIAIFMVITFGVNAVILYTLTKLSDPTYNTYLTLSLSVYTGMATFFALFGGIFAGFIGSKMFKDEVEDGTFLIILSKPSTRGRIIFEKWLAYALIVFIFAFLITASFTLAILFFDRVPESNPDYSKIQGIAMSEHWFKSFILILLIGLVIAYIFASVALMISTKASVGATIGITIAITVAVPIGSILGLFANKTTHVENYVNNNPSQSSAMNLGITEKTLNVEGFYQNLNEFKFPDGKTTLKANPTSKKDYDSAVKLISTWYNAWNLKLMNNAFEDNFLKQTSNDEKVKGGLFNLSLRTKDRANYSIVVYVDLNYQITRLGSIASSSIIPKDKISNAFKDASAGGGGNTSPQTSLKQKVKYTYSNGDLSTLFNKFTKNLGNLPDQLMGPLGKVITKDPKSEYLKSVTASVYDASLPSAFLDPSHLWTDADQAKISDIGKKPDIPTQKPQPTNPKDKKAWAMWAKEEVKTEIKAMEPLFSNLASKHKLQKIEYVDFINKNAILGVYIAITLALIPLSYWIVKKQDYK